MKKHSIFLPAFLLSFAASAQLPFLNSAFDTLGGAGHHYEIALTAGYRIGSNALTNKFINTVYTGGFIDTTLKADVEKKLLLNNRAGFDAEYGALVRVHPDSSSLAWFAGFRNRYHGDALFAGDVFRLGMSGNRRFAGQTAMLGSSNARYLHWQQLTGGMSFSSSEGRTSISIGASVLKGQEAYVLDLPKGDFYTEEHGFEISLDAEYLLNRTDSAHTGFGAVNGLGGSLDFVIETHTADSLSGPIRWWRFAVLDAGFIHWNSSSMYYHRDTTYSFTGVSFSSLSQLQDSTLGQWSADSLTGSPQRKSFNTNLPTTALLEGKLKNFGKFQPGFGIRLRMYANCSPEYFANVIYKPVPLLRIVGEAGYGGYNGFRFSLDVQAGWHGWVLRAGSYNVLAYAIPSSSCGQGLFTGIAKRF